MWEPKDWIALATLGVSIITTFWWNRRAQRIDRDQQRRDALLEKAAPAVVAARSLVASRNPTSVDVSVMSGRLDETELAELIASDGERWREVRDIIGEVEATRHSPIVTARCHELKLALSRHLSHAHLVLTTGTVGEEQRAEELSRAVFNAADGLLHALHGRLAA